MATGILLPSQLGSWTQVGTKDVTTAASLPLLPYSNNQMIHPGMMPLLQSSASESADPFKMQVQAQDHVAASHAMLQPLVPQLQQFAHGAEMMGAMNEVGMTEAQITQLFPRTILIDAKNATSCPLSLQACHLRQEQYKIITARVFSFKAKYNKEKKENIFWFGLIGYLRFREKNEHLRDQLKPILQDFNTKLAMEGISVRFIWSKGSLIACHL